VCKAGRSKSGPGRRRYSLTFRMCEMDSFAIGALGGQASDPSVGQTNGVTRNRCGIQIFSDRVEEAGCRDIYPGDKGATHVIFRLQGSAAEGGTQLGIGQVVGVDAVGSAIPIAQARDGGSESHVVEALGEAASGRRCVVVRRHSEKRVGLT